MQILIKSFLHLKLSKLFYWIVLKIKITIEKWRKHVKMYRKLELILKLYSSLYSLRVIYCVHYFLRVLFLFYFFFLPTLVGPMVKLQRLQFTIRKCTFCAILNRRDGSGRTFLRTALIFCSSFNNTIAFIPDNFYRTLPYCRYWIVTDRKIIITICTLKIC